MKIVVLNGSPKGDISVTMQYVHFLQKEFPQHDLKILNIAQRLQAIEKREETFREIIDEVRSADGVLWAFPLYYLLVHAHYKRFIELIFERGVENAFHGKYTAALSTSIHFYDHTAHNYINAICDDLDMKYAGSFSADMYDLLEENNRKELILFTEHFLFAIENELPTVKTFQSVHISQFDYIPGDVESKVDIGNKKVIVLTDSVDSRTNLGKMIARFSRSFSGKIEVIDLNDVDIKGGCLGCIQCGYDYSCAYGDKDGYIAFFNTKVRPADVLVFAGTIKDRYLSSRWKLFFDRSFFNTHTPTMIGKQIGFIVSGPLGQIPNLRQVFEAWSEVQQGNTVDFITDEYNDSAQIDKVLQSLAERLIRFAGEGYMKPATFLGVGGTKIFRDDIYGRLRFPFLADHKFYRSHGMYDFPQKDYKSRIINSVMTLLIKIPSMRKEIYRGRIKTGMIKPLQKVLEK
jgi:multimeric flavodoxin WrbA